MVAFVAHGASLSARPSRPSAALCSVRRGTRGLRAVAQDNAPPEAQYSDIDKATGKKIRSTASWAYQFVEEFAEKGPGSNPGWDLRPKSKRQEGAGVCDMCRGTGKAVCNHCGGLDFFDDAGNKLPCPRSGCSGVVVECGTCYGTGKQIELGDEWWTGVAQLFQMK